MRPPSAPCRCRHHWWVPSKWTPRADERIVYSTGHGETAVTVPLFDEYM